MVLLFFFLVKENAQVIGNMCGEKKELLFMQQKKKIVFYNKNII